MARLYADENRPPALVGARLDCDLDDLRHFALAALNRPCPYCPRLVADENFACGHQDATARGGSFRLDNLRVCCRLCIETKGAPGDEEFSAPLLLLRDWPEQVRADVPGRLRAGGRWR